MTLEIPLNDEQKQVVRSDVTYDARWCGYELFIPALDLTLETDVGIRGTSPCTVRRYGDLVRVTQVAAF